MHQRHACLPANLERGVGAGNAERARKVAGGHDRGRQFGRALRILAVAPGRLCREGGRGAPCQRRQLCLRRKRHSARVIEPRAQRLELTRLSVEATRLLLQQPTLVIDETAQIGQRRIRCRLGVCRRKRRRDQRRGDRDSEGARRIEMSHPRAARATRMPKRGSCRRQPAVRRARHDDGDTPRRDGAYCIW